MNPSPPTNAANLDSRWSSIRLKENEAATWTVENTSVYVQRLQGDWILARDENSSSFEQQNARKIDAVPLHLEWKRWALEGNVDQVRFWPAFPHLPLVVKTRIPVIIPPHTSVDLFVNIPIWLEIAVSQKNGFYVLDTIAPTELSSTWYGTLFEGELCYAIRSRARRSIDDLEEESLRAVCLFKIRNKSNDSLPVEKMRITPAHLSLHRSDGRLWTSPVTITFRGEGVDSEVEYQANAPEHLSKATLLREAERPYRRGNIFDRILFRTIHQHG